ncbi:hypothetical protein GLOIN_2v1778879 [Rhizophagus clarus]|uniref:Uncharacterized protein n=1 Tax=Rhizophagus clarus TaxID=94130 RepID=A0A8H3M178_9GLOM|nr:hypothetical protein GLOIN_2v1778879 [Rhizophagus clarus]
METLDQPTEARKKIYNPKTNRLIVINRPVYRKLLLEGYMHWREERLLIPPLHELPILRRYLSFISYRIWNIVSERSLLAVVNEKISLLHILLKANWYNLTLCQLLKLCWKREEMKVWINNVIMKFLHHPNLAPSKYRLGALCDAFIKTDVLGSLNQEAKIQLASENAFKVHLDGLEELALDEIVERLSSESTCEKQDIKHVGVCGSSANFPAKILPESKNGQYY